MSVRFNRTGTGVVKDHNELANKGVHTHAELDVLFDEITAARSTYPDLNARLVDIESHATGGGGGGGTGTPSSNYLYEVYRVTNADTTTILLTTGSYEPGTAELEVFRNGVRQKRGEQYTEQSPNSYTFSLPLLPDDLIVSRVRDRAGIVLPANIQQETVLVSDDSITTYSLTHSFADPGQSLEVYLNGVLQTLGVDYSTPDGHTVTFANELQAGSLLLFQVIDKRPALVAKQVEETFTTDGVTTRFTLSLFTYEVGGGELELYLNGIHLLRDVDYQEIDFCTFECTTAPPPGELLAVRENSPKSPREIELENRVHQLEDEMKRVLATLGL